MEKHYFGYVRVSTTKQGEKGVSLQEQQDAIRGYAHRFGLSILQWFEERESAAKRGRPVFTQMLRQLRTNKAQGVIIHKIDRSARNLKDWSDLGELIDSGVEVHFANESLDLHTRGGRLSADIQAVVAADYVRNLREETRKGFYGRLKQGMYPLPAPLGYLDRGKGNLKEIDPKAAPLIRVAFELYGTARLSLPKLLEELTARGLRNKAGSPLSLNGLSRMLNNPFYFGVIRLVRTGETFAGSHVPLIDKSLFDRVQAVLRGKTVIRNVRHDFPFRRLAKCGHCGYSLIGEQQKGHTYYRCQRSECPTNTIREEAIEAAVLRMLSAFALTEGDARAAEAWLANTRSREGVLVKQDLEQCHLRLAGITSRLNRLTDALIDGVIERPAFEERKAALLVEQREIQTRVANLQEQGASGLRRLEGFLELVKRAPIAYKNGNPDEKRSLVKELTSNLTVIAKTVSVTPDPSIALLMNRRKVSYSSPSRGIPRTWNRILGRLLAMFREDSRPQPQPIRAGR